MRVKIDKSKKYEAQIESIRKFCVTKSTGFAGVALLPSYYIIDPKDEEFGKEYAFTNGKAVYFGHRCFKEPPKSQAFVLIHEILHIALRHPQRGKALAKTRMQRGLPWSSLVWNWACDAIINFSMKKISGWTIEPSVGPIHFESLVDSNVLEKKPHHRWGAEELFRYLMDDVIMPKIESGEIGSAAEWGEQNLPKKGQGMIDIVDPMSDDVQPDTGADQRDWNSRVERAAAGDRPGGVMKEILFDLPIPTTPWEHILRRFVMQEVMPETMVTPVRPHRQMLGLEGYSQATGAIKHMPFIPGIRPKPGIRKIVVIADTSGSVSDYILERFGSEMQGMRKRVGCDLVLITADADVHQIIEVKPHENLKKVIDAAGGLKGRGGTDFRPGVEAAEQIPGCACIVYLTDMMGPYPESCRYPILWASTMETYETPPVGSVMVLKEFDRDR